MKTLKLQKDNFLLILSWVAILCSTSAVVYAGSSRERLSMDFGWKFRMGDDLHFEENIINAGVNKGPAGMKFNENAWRSVNIPHDWAVELPFDEKSDRSHGYKPIGPGFTSNSIGWYRRSFTLSKADKGKRLWVEFDGVYRKCQVFLNGYKLTHHEGGYNGFRCDFTDVADCGGKNVLAVRVDASEFEGWFYEGAGIYRHVWLVKTAPIAIAPDGIFVYSRFKDNVPQGAAQIYFETQLRNSQDGHADAKVNWQVLAPDGKVVDETTGWETVDSWGAKEIKGTTKVSSPILWSPESPKLYKLITTVESGGQIVDRKETEFGIRTVGFDTMNGFLLNGKHYVIKGTCNHQDHAGVGIGIPDALQYFRVAKLKEMGCNAIRTSHNPPTAELLEACDRLGILIMDETRNFASDPQSLANLEQLICRDRNHPSVFIWSLGNEEPLQLSDADAAIAVTMRRLAHKLDPTRLCTFAMSSWSSEKPAGISLGVDVQGFNYFRNGDMDGFHKSNPGQPCICSEEGSGFFTRGIYANTSTYKSAYDENYNGNGARAEQCLQYHAARSWTSGTFVWTGFDYRGESTPFGWPNINSEFGIMDMCGFPKDIFYYYQSWWSDKTVLHLMPHWNWEGKEGENIDVRCFSNCDEVELFLNGKSLGKKAMPKNSHLQWNVRYAAGMLSAKGFKGDKIISEEKIETTGAPAGIKLIPDRSVINADGEDLSIVTVAVVDSKGRVVPTANNHINFELSGPGKIIGVGNGDPICHEPDVFFDLPSTSITTLGDWRILSVPTVKDRPEIAEDVNDSLWQKADTRGGASQLDPDKSAIFRTHVLISEKELEADNIVVHFGMIDDDGWVYVNGQFAGESHDWSADPSINIRKFLHTGNNTIAVAVKNNGGPGGLNNGVTLEVTRKQIATNWQRSAFNGLVQVIVQSSKTGGEIRLKAQSDGLSQGSIIIRTEAKGSRSFVE